MQARPLEGIRVVDYSHFLAGPYVGRCLAALGAEVIKVERPGTGDAGRQHATVLDDEQSGYFLQLNMGKRGVSVNMKDPRGGNFDLYLINRDGTGLEQVTFDQNFDGFAMFTADGKKLIWESNRNAPTPNSTNVFIADWTD